MKDKVIVASQDVIPVKRGRGRPRKNPLDMKLSDGKLGQTGSIKQPETTKSVDEIMGFDYLSTYQTNSLEEYTAKLNEMSKLDLQKECTRLAIFPNDNPDRMKEMLTNQFNKYISSIESARTRPIKLKETKKMKEIASESDSLLV